MISNVDQQSGEIPVKKIDPTRYIIYNIIGLALVVIMHHVSPTNLAGPGLDLLFMLGYPVLSIVLMLFSFPYLIKDKSSPPESTVKRYLPFIVNLFGLITSFVLWCIPADIW